MVSVKTDTGAAIDASMLKGEIAPPERYGQRALVYYSEAAGLTPEKLGAILRGANMGLAKPYLTLAIDMEERYLHYSSQLQTRRLAMDDATVGVSAPDGVNAGAVDLVQSLIDDPRFRDLTQDMLDALGKGYSVVEPVWDYQEGALRPVVYQHRDPRYFRYDEIGLRDLHLLDETGQPGLKVDGPYFIKHEPKIRAGVPIRTGLARSASWAFMMQSFALQDWAAFAEIYGVPLRLGKFGPAATDAEKATLLRAVRAIANDASAIIPASMEIAFQETNGNRGEAVFGNLIDYLDRKVSMVVVGQTMTAEKGASLAQAKVHNEVRHDIQKFDARAVAATLNRDLVRPFVAMNLGPQQVYPILQVEIAEPEDIKAFADFLDKAVPLGLKVQQGFARKKAGIPDPQPDDELLVPPKPEASASRSAPARPLDVAAEQLAARVPASRSAPARPLDGHLRGCRCAACYPAARLSADAVDAPDDIAEVDALVADALSDWTEIADPMFAQLLALVDGASSFAEVAAKAKALKIDTSALMEKLAAASAIARGLGDAEG